MDHSEASIATVLFKDIAKVLATGIATVHNQIVEHIYLLNCKLLFKSV